MKSKFRGTLITLVVAAALAGYLYYSERQSEKRAVERDSLRRLVQVDEFEALRFGFSGKGVSLERRGDSWNVVHPVSAPCDPYRIRAFIDTLRAARIEERVDSGNLARYGLDRPAAELTIEARDGTSKRLRFGRINPLQTLVYALVDDSDDVILTTSSLLTYSLTNEFGWRDKRMIDADPGDIVRLRFSTVGSGSLVVQRHPTRVWEVQGRDPWRVDPLKLKNILSVFANLSAVGVAAESKEELARYGLESRRMSAIIEGADGNILGDVVFGLARSEGTYYAMVPDKPEVFEVASEAADGLVRFTRRYRDRKVFPAFEVAAVRRIETISPTDSFIVVRRSVTRWVVTQSTKHDSTLAIDPALISQMLDDLSSIEVVEFPESQPDVSVVSPPEWRINLYGENGWLSGVEVGRRDPNGLHTFVRGPYDDWWTLISVTSLIALPFDVERYSSDESDGGNPG